MKKKLLDRIDVKTPCNESWEEMTGNNEVRFCSHCSKHVYDLSSMTRTRAEKLVRDSNGQLCARYIKYPSGGIVTAPPRLTRIKRQASVAAGVLATSLTVSTLAYSQAKPAPIRDSARPIQETSLQKKKSETPASFSISGVVQDINGAVVAGAKITLKAVNTDRIRSTTTDYVGSFEFRSVEKGDYHLEIVSPGFKTHISPDLHLTDNLELVAEVVVDPSEVVGGLMIEGEPIESTTPPVSTEIQGQPILELPQTKHLTLLGLIAVAPDQPKEAGESGKSKKKKSKLPK